MPISAVALLVSCVGPPELGPKPEPRAASSFATERSFAAEGDAAWPTEGWWRGYGDAQLSRLIEEGLAGSPDVAAALARIRRAEGLAQAAGAALRPTLDATAAAGVRKQSYNMGFPSEFVPRGWLDEGRVGLEAGFDLDLWGRNRAGLAAAISEARAARLDARQAQLLLATAIGSAYADLARLYADRDVLGAAVELRSSTGKLVANRVLNGLDTRAELRQAEAGIPRARADLEAVDESIGLTRNRLAALVGAGPDRGLSIARPELAKLQPHGLPPGVSTDLLARRPDIAAARARTEAAADRIKVARADFYPSIRLSALIGYQSVGLDNLAKQGSLAGNAGPALSLPLFRGGALKGQYRGARAAYDEAVADYDRAVTGAYREVADALTSRRSLGEQLAQSRQALAASEDAYSIARKRYQGGLSTFLDVLTAEERLLDARRNFAALAARAFALDIALIRVLGGGFTADQAITPKEERHG